MSEQMLTRVTYNPSRDAELHALGMASERGEGNPPGLFHLLNDRLTGRWIFAVPLAFVLAAVLGVVGYRSSTVTYQSTGIVRVVPNIVPLLRQTAETGMMPLYSNFLRTQASLITSSRVAERAAQLLDLDALPWETQAEAINAMRGVAANADRNSELVLVTFSWESPAVAQAVVNAVIQAYEEIYGSAHGDEISRRLTALRNLRDDRWSRVRQLRTQLDQAVANSEYGVGDYGTLLNEKASYLHRAELELRRIELMLAVAEANPDSSDHAAGDVGSRQLESLDEKLANLRRLLDNAEIQVELVRERFGPSHHSRLAAEEQLRVLQRMYHDRYDLVHAEVTNSGGLSVVDPTREHALRAEQLRKEIAEEREAIARLTQTQQTLARLRADLADAQRAFDEADNRYRALDVEADSIRSGRVVIAAMGDRPTRPNRDRRKHLALLGGMAGFGMGIGLFFLLGSLDRRAFRVDQLNTWSEAAAGERLLGVLPALPRKGGDPDLAGMAAHCVHQIRNKIEAIRSSASPCVLAITSPDPGDGKTSLALSLAASYATAGSRTVLIDCDIVGKSVSRQTLLLDKPGLRESLAKREVNGHIQSVPLRNLSILPCGMLSDFGPEMVRREDLAHLFAELRSTFNVIIVDTGPIFGSIESLPVSSAADAVVVTMRRGGRHTRLENCLKSLRSVGATYAGLVLNFAHHADCSRYVSTSKPVGETAATANAGNVEDSLRRNVVLRTLTKDAVKENDRSSA